MVTYSEVSEHILEMDYKYIAIFCILLMQSGCSFGNMFKGQQDYLKNYYAEGVKESIDRTIQTEVAKRLGPPGHASKGYSQELWNAHWNTRISSMYALGSEEGMEAYEGPSGPEFIEYLIEKRRSLQLPELQLEERNRDKVPYYLIPENRDNHTN